MTERGTTEHGSLPRFIAAFSVASFVMNWFWEMLQMPAYVDMAGRPWSETAIRCTLATLGDVGISLGIYAVAALAAGRLQWGMTGRWNVYAAAAVLGAVVATAIEWWAHASNRWTYSAAMPVLPIVEVGLWPLLQLIVLVPLALWIAARVCRYPVRHPPASSSGGS